MKLCINCQHWREGNRCAAPEIGQYIDRVTGEAVPWFCSAQRNTCLDNFCGPDAKFFEPLPEPAMAA